MLQETSIPIYGATRTGPSGELVRHAIGDAADELLIATILAGTTGSVPVQQVAQQLLIAVRGDLSKLGSVLPSQSPLSDSGRQRLRAAAELFRRASSRASAMTDRPVQSPEDAFELFKTLGLKPFEQLAVSYLDKRGVPIRSQVVSVGNPESTIVDPRIVLRPALELWAPSFILYHNHPSGDPEPSEMDIAVTERLHRAGKILGITLLDHLVIGNGRYTSLAERGKIPASTIQPGLAR